MLTTVTTNIDTNMIEILLYTYSEHLTRGKSRPTYSTATQELLKYNLIQTKICTKYRVNIAK